MEMLCLGMTLPLAFLVDVPTYLAELRAGGFDKTICESFTVLACFGLVPRLLFLVAIIYVNLDTHRTQEAFETDR